MKRPEGPFIVKKPRYSSPLRRLKDERAFESTHGFMLKMSLMPSGVAAPGGLAGSPSHFSVQVIWTCSPGLWAPSPGVSGVAGVAGLAGVVLSWMSCTCAGGETGEEADFDYETGGEEDECGSTRTLHDR